MAKHEGVESKTPQVSIIMNCYNGEKYLQEAINSIYAQTYKNWEIIFWDNASTDNSAEIAKSYDERLRYFKGDKTVPLYEVRNRALREACGKYIAILDCDDMWRPHKLEKQVALFEKNKNAGLIYSNVEILERDGMRRNKFHTMQPSGRIFRNLIRKYNINLQTVMISREALNSFDHGFDDFLHFGGDADLFLRIARLWDILYLPDVTAVYREHNESDTANKVDLFPMEMEYILCKLSKTEKDFFKKYEYEIMSWRRTSMLIIAVTRWKAGKNREARQFIRYYLSGFYIFFLIYILSFLPYNIFSFVRKLVGIK